MMVPNLFEGLLSLAFSALIGLGAIGLFVAWGGVIYAYYSKKIPAFLAIMITSSLMFACAFILAWQIASTKATNEAEFQCRILQEKARTAGKEAANKGLLAIIDEQKRRLKVADAATETANASAKRLVSQLEQAETKRFDMESQINESEKDLPENLTCTTSDALYRELSD